MDKKIAVSFGEKTKRKRYLDALSHPAFVPVENPTALQGFSGLVLTGGTDVDPARYNKPREPKTEKPDPKRDEREGALLREALERDLPVLAICRGMQLLNVELGGTLIQHIEGHRDDNPDVHNIRIVQGTKLSSILKLDQYGVNSRHHQSVARVGEGLVVSATAPDGIIEALELPDKRFVVAVQWHPEDRIDGPDRKLFEAFAAACCTATSAVPA